MSRLQTSTLRGSYHLAAAGCGSLFRVPFGTGSENGLGLERRAGLVAGAAHELFEQLDVAVANDAFGHPAGDALLLRLGNALAAAVAPFGGRAYRPGGDEFCVIAGAERQRALEEATCAALAETGEGFAVSTAFGSVVIPRDTGDATEAMRKADEAMYAQKHSGRATAERQSSDVLLRALAERHPDLGDHFDGVAELAVEVGRRLGIEGDDAAMLRHAAALHDVGKAAIPDAIITKPAAFEQVLADRAQSPTAATPA